MKIERANRGRRTRFVFRICALLRARFWTRAYALRRTRSGSAAGLFLRARGSFFAPTRADEFEARHATDERQMMLKFVPKTVLRVDAAPYARGLAPSALSVIRVAVVA